MKSALEQLQSYKIAIDEDIASYADSVRKSARQEFGDVVADVEVETFLDILSRGGKRIRGALVLAGYEMCGGKDLKSVIPAARAIEMLHAYILMVDDIQDRSALRRSKPTAHKMLEDYHHANKLKGTAEHAGISLALNAAIAGAHISQTILANLDADPERRIRVLSITNRTMAITAHGQTLDIMNELVDAPSQEDIDRVLEWKTALYTVINPLQVGMVLAGAECPTTTAITPYGTHAGRAFQITDDILGIFGDEKDLGKTPGDDIREGKGTLLTLYALQHAAPEDKKFLQESLGNLNLTETDFEKCKEIIKDSGALAHAQNLASKEADQAIAELEKAKHLWTSEGVEFLIDLTRALQSRVA